MGNSPYLTRRGRVFWFRRRPPARALHGSLTPSRSTESDARRNTAPGHMAISLRTQCPFEARRRGARILALFEFGWAAYERVMSQTPKAPDDPAFQRSFMLGMLEVLQRNVAQTGHLIQHVLPEAARLGQLDLLDAQSRREILALVPTAPAPTEPTGADCCYDDPAFLAAVLETAERQGWHQEDPAEIVEQFEWMLVGLSALQEEYLGYCARKGLNPATALPTLAGLGPALKATADAVGIDLPGTNTPVKHRPALIEAQVVSNDALPAAVKTPSPTAEPAAPQIKSPPAIARKPAPSDACNDRDPVLLSEFSKRYLDLRCRGFLLEKRNETEDLKSGARFRASSRRNIEATVGLFLKLWGDMPVADLTEAQCIEFISLLSRLPKSHGKSAKDQRGIRDLVRDTEHDEQRAMDAARRRAKSLNYSPGEIEDAVNEAKIPRLSANTCVRHMRDFSRLLAYSVFDGIRADNPIKEFIWSARELKNRTSQETRIVRTGWGDDLPKLLDSAIYRDPLDDPGDPLFWAPLLGLFAGLRMEEALQLRVTDFKTEGGIPFIDITLSDDDQNLKNESSRRRVPIHSALLDLGLLQFVEMRRSKQQGRLFTFLKRGQVKGKFSELFSKNFTHYRKGQGIYDESKDFHSLRTEFQTQLTYAKVPEHTRKALMGHLNSDVTHRNYYPGGDPISLLKSFIDEIKIDISKIRRPFSAESQAVNALDKRKVGQIVRRSLPQKGRT